ncbi:hypothetical protein AAFF_G00002690 [Aldrovandia affinis]|uniref:Mif2/CENP-C cupin domain-containing protein n=1 Tax=Aldrovandia affinis TaxID=143900 RepID=A0AAD7X3G0_9TELE|nr:hypothetical protein AAFF_G00002690 [Aldrovandia affinis]
MWKETSPIQVSPHLEADEDFMILEGENLRNSRWFLIPRRTEENKLPLQHHREVVMHNKEGCTAETAANLNHNPAQKKQNYSKGAKCKKTNGLDAVDQKTKGTRRKGVDKMPLDIVATVQSKAMQNSMQEQEKVGRRTETQAAHTVDEDGDGDGDVPLLLRSPEVEKTDETPKQSKAKQLRRCPREIREKPVNIKNGGVGTPLNTCENEVPLEQHEMGKRKKMKPGSWWLLGQEKQTDECSNKEIHSSVPNKRRKQNKTAPELIPSPDAVEEVSQENDRIQPKMTSSQGARKNTQTAKKKSASNRRIQTLKKVVPEVSSLPEESEEGSVDGGGEDHEHSHPSPYPGQHRAPTPNETQKQSKGKQLRRCPREIRENTVNIKNGGVVTPLNTCENEVPLEQHEMGKRKKMKPGSWWLLGQEKQTDECSNKEIHSSVPNKRRKQNKTAPELISSLDAVEEVSQENDRMQPKLTSSQSAGKNTQTAKKKSASNRRIQTLKKVVPEVSSLPEESEEGSVDGGGEDHEHSHPSPYPGQHRAHTPRNGSQHVFDKVYSRHKQDRRPNNLRLSSHRSPLPEKGQMTAYTWQECGESEAFAVCSNQLHHNPKTQVLPKPQKGSKSSIINQTFSKRNHLHAPRNTRASLASFGAIFTPVSAKTTQTARHSSLRQTVGLTETVFPSQGDQCVSSKRCIDVYDYCQNGSDYPANCPTAKTHSRTMHGKQHSGTLTMDSRRVHQFDELQSEVYVCNSIKSGPSSMIDIQEKSLPSCQSVVSKCQMCGPPLKPVTLQMEDWEDLVIWLKNVWPSPDGAPIISPEHFQWYGYRGRVMGYRTDLQYETFSNGKILLGSYMNKPMQVDNNAISVYNILTSSVCVTISGVEADLSSGETFVVPCGHAYGMRNLTKEPAVLLYHRMVADIWE